MDDPKLKLLAARRVIEAERALRYKAEHELKQARLEVTRLRRAVVSLQRQATRGKGNVDATAA